MLDYTVMRRKTCWHGWLVKVISVHSRCTAFRKFHDKWIPTSLQNGMTKQYTSLMLQHKIEYSIQNGKSLCGSKEKGTDEDITCFTTICFWNGDLKSTEFLHLFVSAIDNVGRCSEITVITWDKGGLASNPKPGGKVFKTIQINVNRLKKQVVNPGEDKIVHFVHTCDFSKCYVFTMFHHLILGADPVERSDHIFPSWYGAVTSTESTAQE